MARREDTLKVVEHEHHTEVNILRPCTVRWSVDGTLWHELGYFMPGSIWRDYDAPEGKRRNYMTLEEGGTQLTYLHREATRAFAELMAPWFGGGRRRS